MINPLETNNKTKKQLSTTDKTNALFENCATFVFDCPHFLDVFLKYFCFIGLKPFVFFDLHLASQGPYPGAVRKAKQKELTASIVFSINIILVCSQMFKRLLIRQMSKLFSEETMFQLCLIMMNVHSCC